MGALYARKTLHNILLYGKWDQNYDFYGKPNVFVIKEQQKRLTNTTILTG